MPMDPIQQSGVVFVLAEFGEFEKVSGGQPTTEFTPHYEAGARTPSHNPGTTAYSDLVLERAYRPDRDKRVAQWHQKYLAGLELPRDGQKQFRNFQGVPVNIETFPMLKPASVETPDGESGGNAMGMCRVTLKVTGKI